MNDDLISRKALKREFGYTDEWYKGRTVCGIIDDAPTVDIAFDPQYKADLQGAYDCGKYSRPKGKWIPVTERLPEENGVYLVTLEYVDDSEIVNEIDMAWFMYSEKDDSNNGFHKAYPITAWQPLPEPYER